MTSRPATGDASGPEFPVLVRHEGRTWRLVSGRALTFGRGSEVDIALAHEPPDLRVSRHTGTLRHLVDTVLIINASTRGVLTVMANGAATREISAGEAITCDPQRRFRVCVVGEFGMTYDLDVDATSLPAQGSVNRPQSGPGTVLFTQYDLTPGQRRVLIALCAPLLAGEARSATAREIAQQLNLQPNYVRNVLKDTRERLAGQGVPGMLGEDNPQAVEALRQALAQWALRNRAALDF